MILRIHRSFGRIHYSDASDPSGAPLPGSCGYQSFAEATAAAIEYARAHSWLVQAVTGHADRDTALRLGVQWMDERGNKRMGKRAAERQRDRRSKILEAVWACRRGEISAVEKGARIAAIKSAE